MFCPQCGTNNEEDAIWCIQCGTRLNPFQEEQPIDEPVEKIQEKDATAPVVAPEPKRSVVHDSDHYRKRAKMLKVGIVACVILLLVSLGISEIQTGDADSDYAYITVTIYNDQNETMNVAATSGDITFISSVDLPVNYFQYNTNYTYVHIDGSSMTITITASGTGLTSGITETDSKTLTLLPGEHYRVILHL